MTLTKKLLTLFSLLLASPTIFADNCPDIKGLDPLHPPSGWTLNIPPIVEDQTYYFSEAIHSLNGSFYYQQVMCIYKACDSAFCPAFSLLSNTTYTSPILNSPPWDAKSRIAFTLTCKPEDHHPSRCVFQ
jgi:hypothetical protein